MTTHRQSQKKQTQHSMLRYVWLLLSLIVVLSAYGALMMVSSVQVAYQAQKLGQENAHLAEEIASLESQYHTETKKYQAQIADTSQNMVVYSPKDSHVRYARVGGAVYSMLESRTF